MSYTLSTLNAPAAAVPWIAGCFATYVLFLDREIAGSFDKSSAILRPLLALLLGSLAAISIELWVFHGRIDQELQRQYRIENAEQFRLLSADEGRIRQRRADLEATLRELRKQEAEWARVMDSEAVGRAVVGRTGIAGTGPAFVNAQRQQDSVRQRITEVRDELRTLDLTAETERTRSEKRFHREEVLKVTDFVTRYEALQAVLQKSQSLYHLSWLITLTLVLIEITPALLKFLTAYADYHHLAQADIRERCAQVDELGERNFRLAIENPEATRLSVAEKLALARFGPITNATAYEKRYETEAQD